MKWKNPNIILVIIILIVLALLFFSSDLGFDIGEFLEDNSADDNDDNGGGTAPIDESDDEEDEETPTGSWHSTTAQGAGILAGGDFESASAGLTGIPPFGYGDAGNVIITLYTIWTDPNGCSPCDPGLVWCIHDSTGAQIYHATEPNPKATTTSIMGVWDGVTPWTAFIGNNCVCDINYAFRITIQWYE